VIGGDVADELFRDGLCLPSGSAMSEKQVNYICNVIRQHFT